MLYIVQYDQTLESFEDDEIIHPTEYLYCKNKEEAEKYGYFDSPEKAKQFRIDRINEQIKSYQVIINDLTKQLEKIKDIKV